MVEATSTRTALDCNSLNFDQVTFLLISSQDSEKYVVNFSMVLFLVGEEVPHRAAIGLGGRLDTAYKYSSSFVLHGWRDSNSQPTVLETATLPIELHPFIN